MSKRGAKTSKTQNNYIWQEQLFLPNKLVEVKEKGICQGNHRKLSLEKRLDNGTQQLSQNTNNIILFSMDQNSKAFLIDQFKETARQHYNRITYENRKQLINLVQEQGHSIYRASQIIGINNSTAKVILRNYRRKGLVFRRKSERNNKSSPKKEKNHENNNLPHLSPSTTDGQKAQQNCDFLTLYPVNTWNLYYQLPYVPITNLQYDSVVLYYV